MKYEDDTNRNRTIISLSAIWTHDEKMTPIFSFSSCSFFFFSTQWGGGRNRNDQEVSVSLWILSSAVLVRLQTNLTKRHSPEFPVSLYRMKCEVELCRLVVVGFGTLYLFSPFLCAAFISSLLFFLSLTPQSFVAYSFALFFVSYRIIM